MGELVPQEHGGALYRPSKGETPNPNGRPKKWMNTLIESGYSKSQINDCYTALLAQTEEKLIELRDDKSLDILVRKTAKALLKEWDKGTIYNQEVMITRVHGQPKEEIDQRTEMTVKINIIKASEIDDANRSETIH